MTAQTKPRRFKRHGKPAIRARIEELAIAGWKASDIAREVDRTRQYVNVAISQMRKSGRLPPKVPAGV